MNRHGTRHCDTVLVRGGGGDDDDDGGGGGGGGSDGGGGGGGGVGGVRATSPGIASSLGISRLPGATRVSAAGA